MNWRASLSLTHALDVFRCGIRSFQNQKSFAREQIGTLTISKGRGENRFCGKAHNGKVSTSYSTRSVLRITVIRG